MADASTLTLFFVIDQPRAQDMACFLAASIRQHMPPGITLIAYCPEHLHKTLEAANVETLRRLRCEVRPFVTEQRFVQPGPGGNRILACLEPRTTKMSGLLDCATLILRPMGMADLPPAGTVRTSSGTDMQWDWDTVPVQIRNRIADLDPDRVDPIRHCTSDLVIFPEGPVTPDGQTFAEIWLQNARLIDWLASSTPTRPPLDLPSLPFAILQSELAWQAMPDLHRAVSPDDAADAPFGDSAIVQYRDWDANAAIRTQAQAMLRNQVGTRRIHAIWRKPPPPNALPDPAAPAAEDQPVHESAREKPARPARPWQPSGRAPIAAMTMVHADHHFLEIWMRYYSAQIGRENLYVLRHGHDPAIDEIAAGANIIHLPNPPDRSGFDRRRWSALSKFASSLTASHEWVLCNDVDEIVIVDPDVAPDLQSYLMAKLAAGDAPRLISPFALEIVHTPDSEPEPIRPDVPLLQVRRNYRLNSNYAKPCLTRRRINFSSGGHGCDADDVVLDPHLYLLHLRYMDDTISRARLTARAEWMIERHGDPSVVERGRGTWDQGVRHYEALSQKVPLEETIDFPEFRQRIIDGRRRMPGSRNWQFRSLRSPDLYRLPERFSSLL